MFGAAQLPFLAAQANAKAQISFGDDAEIAKCESLRGQIPLVVAIRAGDVRNLIAGRGDVRRPEIEADELGLLLDSSGTTSTPKGIMHSRNTLRYATEQIVERRELTPQDTHLVVCEFNFGGSLAFGYLAILLSGANGRGAATMEGRRCAPLDRAASLLIRPACRRTLRTSCEPGAYPRRIIRASRGTCRR
jgi:cyclohexanecarboxylate-CoA ligase